MTLDRKQIMITAWEKARLSMKVMQLGKGELRRIFSYWLRHVWKEAKAAAGRVHRAAATIYTEIVMLENCDRIGLRGMEKLTALQSEYYAALAAEKVAA